MPTADLGAPTHIVKPARAEWRVSPHALTFAAIAITIASTLVVWRSQYFVDSETTLLPWLTSRGWVLYRDMIDQHPPLFTALLVPLGGAGAPGSPLHLVVVGLHLLTLIVTYAVASQIGGRIAGLASVALAAIWTVAFEGTHLWYDGALAPLYLLMLLLAFKLSSAPGASTRLSFALGLLVGLGLLVKQQAVLAVPFIGLSVWAGGRNSFYLVGMALPLAVAGAIYAFQGTLGDAWYWVVVFSLTSNYTVLAGLPPSATEWPALIALYLPSVALLVSWGGRERTKRVWPTVAFFGLLLAATVPAWPRYGRFHLLAAVPLLAVAGGLAVASLGARLRIAPPTKRGLSIFGLLLVASSALFGSGEWLHAFDLTQAQGPPATPYVGTIAPLRKWVDAHAPPHAPILVLHLDSMLYRVLEREPPRPWTPQLPWILQANNTEARWWETVDSTHPKVAIVSAGGWDASPYPGFESGEARLRHDYHEAVRFQIVNYPHAPPVTVVCLLRN